MAKAQNYSGGGGHRTEKCKLRRGDTAHTFLMGGTIGVGENMQWFHPGKLKNGGLRHS